MDLAPLAPTMRLAERRLGDTLGRYTLTGVLGVGGMATVYKAVHRNGDKVALKLLHPHFATREDVRARFVQEAYTANKVAHPGAVRVIDDDVAPDGSAFMVMDLLEGETLDAWQTRDGPMLPAEAVFDVVHQVLDVLVHAHARDIVHRDLKPENLHRASEGRVTVLDFGIARVLDEATAVTRTRTGSLLGTPAFMPPEQAQGRAERIDGRTDLWALGATAFTLLSGRYVHEAETVALLNIASGTQEARAIGPLVPGLPPSLAAIVDKALKFEQADRWRSARAMQEALEEAFAEVFGRALATPQQAALRAALPSAPLPSAPPADPTEAAREEAATAIEPASSRTRTSTTGAGVVSAHPASNPPAAKGRARGWGVLALVALAG
ncbi:MAG TPA: serine/threonine-protein kinase, partial [Polyangiaceae bacterium]|nr:serine/threonine-protein kinase [Polyangiaceae bacterium]